MGFQHGVPHSHRNVAQSRFHLRNGQFFGEFKFKNLWWVLDGVTIGYGDLREQDIDNIQENLYDDEVFIGWNEHHGGRFQQTNEPMIRITKREISYPHAEKFQVKEN